MSPYDRIQLSETDVDYLQRYLTGEHETVWRELCKLGQVERSPDLSAESEAVAMEVMNRVAANVDRIIEQLETRGYEFGRYPDGEPVPGVATARVKPSDELAAAARSLQARVGAIPLSLRSFWQVVGEVTLVGRAPGGGLPDYSDPLWVEGPAAALVELDDGAGQGDAAGGFLCPIAPDVLHKDNVSGGAPYAISLPNTAFDAPVEQEWHGAAFVTYLRTAILEWGGFPGLSQHSPQHQWRRGYSVAPWVAELKNDLQPF
jgi:hypothetical protein